MIEVKNLQKTYRSHGQTVGLLGADFTVPDGQIVGVLGENGAGKTTMLRCIAELLPHKGTALLDGRPAGEQYGRISYITGEGSYYPALTVAAYGQLLADLHPAFDPARYAKFLEFFSLHGSDVIGHLSTGQRARVELAAGFAKRVPYYLMDEPFLGKDPFTRRDFIKLMSATLTGGETLLLSTHYIEDVDHFLDRALILHNGRIAEDLLLDTLTPGDTLLNHMPPPATGTPNGTWSLRKNKNSRSYNQLRDFLCFVGNVKKKRMISLKSSKVIVWTNYF